MFYFQTNFGLEVATNYSRVVQILDKKDEPIAAKILSIILGGTSLLVVIFRVFVALGTSQTKRIRRILQGANKNVANELGFMHKIEMEVEKIL